MTARIIQSDLLRIYLATPYSHPDEAVRRERFDAACRAAGYLMGLGYIVFSPIAHNTPIRNRVVLPATYKFWVFDRDFCWLSFCHLLAILTLPGHEKSKGIGLERGEAQRLRQPIILINPLSYEAQLEHTLDPIDLNNLVALIESHR